ncbi:MAG: anaerobic glycerol-3-phosphate dehydrogenase subunit C [Pirellulaceae bacterium]
MDPEQIRIQADLRGLIEGDVHCDSLFTQIYASDASIYEIKPLGVARPRSTRDVSELLKYCHQNQLPVFPRGGGSGLAGQSLGRGIIVDFSRYMRRIHPPRSGFVRVQSGVVQADLNRSIDYHHLLFGPDPATRSVSSIGSMLSVDAAGSHFPRYGSAGDCVESLQVVLSSGEVVELSSHAWGGLPTPAQPAVFGSTVFGLPVFGSQGNQRTATGNALPGQLAGAAGQTGEAVARAGATADRSTVHSTVPGDTHAMGPEGGNSIGETPSAQRVQQLAEQVGLLLQQNSGLLLRPPWQDLSRGTGYCVEKVLDGDQVNLARLMCGAEGTLGVITEATLRVDAIPKVRGLILLFFSRLETAAKAVLEFGREEVTACDLMDRRLLEIARETEPVYESIIPRGAEAMLLVEVHGDEPQGVRARLMQLLQRLQRRGKPVVSYRLTTDSAERNMLWRLARRVIPRLYKLKGNLRPLPFVEDILVPPKRLPEFLRDVQDILKLERVTATMFAHALHGQVDIRPFLDLGNTGDQLRMASLSETLIEKVLEYGGAVGGSHSFGLSRAGWAEKQLGPRLELFRKIKSIFDPVGILNPGKFLSPAPPHVNENLRRTPKSTIAPQTILFGKQHLPVGNAFDAAAALEEANVASPDSSRASSGAPLQAAAVTGVLVPSSETLPDTDTLKAASLAGTTSKPRLPVLLAWENDESAGYAARNCNGCGRCRTNAAAERMCPVFRVHKGEEASPRAKANLLRGVITGALEPEHLESVEMKQMADLCFNCHQCRMECPASVDIPKIVQEIKAQHVAGHGLSLSERLLNRVDILAALGSRFPNLSNWALGNRAMRWLLEKSFGIAGGRKLPKVARRTFLRWAAREKLNRIERAPGRKVLFFVDQYVNWHNPLLGRALVEVLRHQKVELYIPTAQTPSYMAMIAAGDVERARKLVRTNISLLAEAVRQGYTIVTTEPSAALCLQQEYRHLFESEETELIAAHTYEACSYLWKMHTRNELELDFRPVSMSVMYHEPCHSRIMDSNQPALNLLRLVPGLQVQTADAGCSGMAGTFGLQRKNYRTSLRIGWPLVSTMKGTSAQFGTTECTSCKLQMEQATTKPTVHPIAILAYAYGHMPQFGAWFSSRTEGTVVS